MSRDQLMTSVRAVASGLSRLGVGKGDIVALYAGNHMEFPVIFLAITAIGATVAPINPFYRKGSYSLLTNKNERYIISSFLAYKFKSLYMILYAG
jgi:cyclohexanecarboxylate-CoA ligase